MHEVSLMENALELAKDHAMAQQATRIHRIHLRVGRLSGVVADALRFAFEGLKPGTLAEDAILEVEEVEVVCLCQSCQIEFPSADWIHQCPGCGESREVTILQGTELELVSLEVS
ncbi:MAG: hydrogenase maturation nickel metallochaperone HypA [Gemmataceae bacterium]